ncbi:hypothetical protein LCGC14_2130610, partial [marine sediment metagenome]
LDLEKVHQTDLKQEIPTEMKGGFES